MERFLSKKQKNKVGVAQTSSTYLPDLLPWIFAARRRTTKSHGKGFGGLLERFLEKSFLKF
jgi:hypothetical protein